MRCGGSTLDRPVRPALGSRPLGQVLAELARQSSLPFSYSSSRVPVGRRCYLPTGPPRSPRAALAEVLAGTRLSYGLLNGQLVLWPARQAVPASITQLNGAVDQPAAPGDVILSGHAVLPGADSKGARRSSRPATQGDELLGQNPASASHLLPSATRLLAGSRLLARLGGGGAAPRAAAGGSGAK